MVVMSTKSQIINCKAAVVGKQYELKIENIQVHPPKDNEVRVQVKACGVSRRDTRILNNPPVNTKFPLVLGHEATGIVESVGEKVRSVSVGDHVSVSMLPQCGKCALCRDNVTNFCEAGTADGSIDKFTMSDGTTRLFTSDGQPLYKFLNVGGFAEYLVTTDNCVTRIGKDIPLEKFCLFGSCIPSGHGSVYKLAKLKRGATVAIWGLGTVGLGAILGAKDAFAKEIICIANNNDREPLAKKLGCTTFINTTELNNNEPLDKILREKYGGIDAGIDCVGSASIINTSITASKPWGVTVVNGTITTPITINPMDFLSGRKLIGASYGGWRGKDAINYFAKKYKAIPLDDMITSFITLDELAKTFEQHNDKSNNIKTVVRI